MSGKNPLGNGREPQSYEGTNAIFPISGFNVIKSKVDPGTNRKFPVPSIWLNTVLQNCWIQVSPGVWDQLTTSSGNVLSVSGTTNQVTVSPTSGNAVVSLPSTITTPGSLTTTTTITGGTGVTATTGNVTATSGNFVSSTLGDGILLNSGTASGTTAATLNGRVGQITITTPSIAAGSQFTFTITNSSVTASTTQVGYWLTGGTNGAALTIQSVTNSASQSVVVLNNGTGATANTASLVLTFLVLNT